MLPLNFCTFSRNDFHSSKCSLNVVSLWMLLFSNSSVTTVVFVSVVVAVIFPLSLWILSEKRYLLYNLFNYMLAEVTATCAHVVKVTTGRGVNVNCTINIIKVTIHRNFIKNNMFYKTFIYNIYHIVH